MQLAGVNETHKQITHLRAMDRPIEQRILAMQNRLFDSSLDDIVIEWGSRLPQKQSQWTPISAPSCVHSTDPSSIDVTDPLTVYFSPGEASAAPPVSCVDRAPMHRCQ